jgi:hypothetical protein
MGTTMSMDVSGANTVTVIEDPISTNSIDSTTTFEDALRQEVILVPEDMEDIHIQATTTPTSSEETVATAAAASDNNAHYGRGKHWKKNLKKKQAATTPVQTERTIEQRREQVRPIVDKLMELQMNVSYPAIRELYKQLSHFVKTGEDTKIKIAFPEFSRKIKGELSNAPYIPCWVKLEME